MAKYLQILAMRGMLQEQSARSAWDRGVKAYAVELLDSYEEQVSDGWREEAETPYEFERALLNGASGWSQYSWDGCSLIYNMEIAKRLCTPSELRKKDDGRRPPNGREEWLDVQARALTQAAWILWDLFRVTVELQGQEEDAEEKSA